MAEVDLERLASAYDHRPDLGRAARVADAVDAAGLRPGDLVIDVGGGRGHHAGAMAADPGCRVVVVDPAVAMAAAAIGTGVPAVVGRGEDLPLADEIAHLTYFHLSIHHGDWRRMLAEAWRVTRPGGTVFVWTMGPAYHRASFLSHWFPRVGEIDADRFPAVSDLVSAFEALGGSATVGSRADIVVRTAGEWVAAVEAGFVSTLHLLSDEEIAAGLAAFRAAHPDPAATIRYRLDHTSVWSIRPSVES